jgi:hypothetical protein
MAATPSSAWQQALKGVALSMKLEMAWQKKLLVFIVYGNTNVRCFRIIYSPPFASCLKLI